MKFDLMKGTFSKEDAFVLITKIVDVKIKYHEEKISKSDNEEDIKMRENRIKQLQKSLYDARLYLNQKDKYVEILSELSLQ